MSRNIHLMRWAKLYAGTESEHALEPAIASAGLPYRWQHPVWAVGCFLDYAWHTHKVAIEIDGASHTRRGAREKDAVRTAKLENLGWKVLRCTNEEAVADPYGTVRRLLLEAGLTPDRS
jgi:very-short-patch-repair endonuclease